MVADTGTYLDSPFPWYADEKDLSQIRLSRLANLVAIKISAKGKPAIEKPDFPDAEDLPGKAVLVEILEHGTIF
jgi:arylformamidase